MKTIQSIYIVVSALAAVALVSGGCVTKAAADAQARAAYLAGEREGEARVKTENDVWMIGNVKNQLVPWTPELTLAKAIVAADYQGTRDPGEILVNRSGEQQVRITTQQILNGYDLPLKPGDRIEIRP